MNGYKPKNTPLFIRLSFFHQLPRSPKGRHQKKRL